MSLVVFQHESHENAGVLGEVLQRHGHRLRTIRLYQGDPLPIDLDDVDGLIILGGAANVTELKQHAWMEPEIALIKEAHERGLPIVGICLGHQLIAAALGGEVEKMEKPDAGWVPLKVSFPGTTDPIFSGVTWDAVQFLLHGQEVTKLPAGATPLASTAKCRTQAMKVGLTTYGFQFHFEWPLEDLKVMSNSALFASAGVASETVLADAPKHYMTYRRLGDRLCENIATYLFPIDKRQGR